MLTDVHGPDLPETPRGGPLSRRALLSGSALAGAVLLVGACTSAPSPAPTVSPDPGPDPDEQVRAGVAADEAQLLALYDAVIAAHPALAASLTAIRAEHAEHAAAMGVSATPPAPPAVGSRAEAVAALIAAEQQAIAQRTVACEASAEGDLARLTALIAASEAGHAEFLRGLT
jgi:hypothetical protein